MHSKVRGPFFGYQHLRNVFQINQKDVDNKTYH